MSAMSPYPGEHKVAPSEIRFVPREYRLTPRKVVWEVYDRQTGSVGNRRFGTEVKQNHALLKDAQAECDRLEGLR